ncbi:MAG TPA: tyrosine--tRNA ligase [Nevskiaceae bacterium]|nr:tyrosine--tRNA ligase [Nevskiaceae bacterium]
MDKIDEILSRGVEKIYPSRKALEKALRSGRKIRVYNGIDPTNPNIHLGNAIPIRKLRQFQDLGHKVILLIGDFTARIGDPSDKTAMRHQLTHKEVLKNTKTYKEQVAKILNFDSKNNPPEIRFNSEWLDKLTNKDVIELAAGFTVQQMIERDLFQNRLKEEKPIGLHEFLYPLYQGYDSVALDVNLEVGGREQTFNMLAGRTLMKIYKNKEKFVLTNPWLPGTDGRKMSKSWGNVINITDKPEEMFGKLMSITDEVIETYFELCTNIPIKTIRKIITQINSNKLNPMEAKKQLAREVVSLYHSPKQAQKAQEEFEKVFQKQKLPTKIPVFKTKKTSWSLINLLVESKLIPSKSEAKRLVRQGAVEINKQKTTDPKAKIKIKDCMIIRVGKRKFIKLKS